MITQLKNIQKFRIKMVIEQLKKLNKIKKLMIKIHMNKKFINWLKDIINLLKI